MKQIKQSIAVLLIFCLLLWPAGSTAGAMTVKEEKELAEEFLVTINDHYHVIDDYIIHKYINDLGGRILKNLPPQPFDYKFHVISQDTINAFAGPAGNIFIFSGLFEAMDNESELAGIVAHEIAHVSARHISDILEKSKKSQMLSMAGMIAGILVGLGGASAVGSALSMGSLAAGQSMILAYTRENELEADFLGRRYLLEADYDLYGLREALRKIREREWYGEEQVPTYLKTHPATRQRLTNLENMLADHPETKPADSFAFQRTKARLIALYGQSGRAVKHFGRQIERNPGDVAARYGLALALAESAQPESAVEAMEKTVSMRPDDPAMAVDLGRIYFLSGKHQAAVKTLSNIDHLSRYGPEGLFFLGRSHMSTGDADKALEAFREANENFPDHERTLYFLGNSYGEQGRLDQAHYYLGRYYLKTGDPENARFHFNRALEKTGSETLTEKIHKELEKTKKEAAKNKKSADRSQYRDTSLPGTLSRQPGKNGAGLPPTSGQNGKISW